MYKSDLLFIIWLRFNLILKIDMIIVITKLKQPVRTYFLYSSTNQRRNDLNLGFRKSLRLQELFALVNVIRYGRNSLKNSLFC